eukprot:TRINITY_DN2206_c1_g1_i1.p1 TRINITY_DN2206_c1_g1~~TRINITY_DN2206_c1_g1_i1.p1  ORF type:complete len:266 (+),score=54.21 TRINITY_DN2206_c1_g1_i1:47-844(+)
MDDDNEQVNRAEASKRTRTIIRQLGEAGEDLAVARGEEEERLGGAADAVDEDEYENEMGNKMTGFNLKEIRETGKFEGAGYTEGEKRDPWLYMVDEAVIDTAALKKDEGPEIVPPPPEELILKLLAELGEDETVNQAINRLGKVVDAIRKRKRAKKAPGTPAPTKTLDEAKDDLNELVTTANFLLAEETAIHTFTSRQLQFHLDEMLNQHTYEIEWQGKEGELHGPFKSEQLRAWGISGFLDKASIRKVSEKEFSDILKKVFTRK